MKKIVLTTLNARYSHTSIALRYLYANLHQYQADAKILEFVINEDNQKIAEQILDCAPLIVGIGVYIWNAKDVVQVVQTIKQVAPQTIIVLGGPEVSHYPLRVNFDLADYIIAGEGEVSFFELVDTILNHKPPAMKWIQSPMVDFATIQSPYPFYDENDIKNRHIYIEASRGCPFSCEFCLSSIDNKMRYLPLATLLEHLENLWQKGARNFKFIDRTFNINIGFGIGLLEYFLSKDEPYFAHFEVIPDNFPSEFKTLLTKFAPASLQLEVGIQTLNLEVAKNIKRNLKIPKIIENIEFLTTQTKAHLHLDLIVGLPGETLDSFASNLNFLTSISSCEIQIGILKKLSGTSLNRHDEIYKMIYNPLPPYDLLQNDLIDFKTMQTMKRFARFWDIVYNSGNFTHTLVLFKEDGDLFGTFLAFTHFVYDATKSTYNIAQNRMAQLIVAFFTQEVGLDARRVLALLELDFPRQKQSIHGAQERQTRRLL